MKVLHIIPSISPVRGGPSKAVLEIVKDLINQGVEAEIATTNDSGSEVLTVPLKEKYSYNSVPTWFFSRYSSSINSVREFAFSPSFTNWLWKSISQYDLLHVHAIFSYPSTVAMAIARYQNIPYISRPLGQLCHWALEQSKTKKKFYLNLIEQKNLNHAKALHFTAELEQREVQSLKLQPPGVVIPLGVSLPDFQASINEVKSPPSTLLFLSRLHPKKGIENLLQAWQQLRPQGWELIIAGSGDGDYVKSLQHILNVLNLNETVKLVGAIEGEAKWNLYHNSDLFVLPTFSENFGIVVPEALACGVPVITTKGTPWSDLVTYKCGWWIDVGVEPLIKTLKQAMALSCEERQIMGERGRHFVALNYTWQQTANKLIEVYEAILNDRPIPYVL